MCLPGDALHYSQDSPLGYEGPNMPQRITKKGHRSAKVVQLFANMLRQYQFQDGGTCHSSKREASRRLVFLTNSEEISSKAL